MEGTDCNKQSDKRVRLDYSREAALQNNCRSFSSMFVVVMGFHLLLGQRLGEGLDLGDFVGTLPLGGLILSAYISLLLTSAAKPSCR